VTYEYYSVSVTDKLNGKTQVCTLRADCWQSAVLSHPWLGAEFENLVDEADLEQRAAFFQYEITVNEL